MTGELVDMFKAGIVEPFKVTRSALQNAASIGALHPHDRDAHRRQARSRRRTGGGMPPGGGMGGYDMM